MNSFLSRRRFHGDGDMDVLTSSRLRRYPYDLALGRDAKPLWPFSEGEADFTLLRFRHNLMFQLLVDLGCENTRRGHDEVVVAGAGKRFAQVEPAENQTVVRGGNGDKEAGCGNQMK